ncbi:hypothetical protein LP419_20460 [Massilia sp. H-1]|nr:hypothetical protein LP419_20460 [Massilia sp. H-1]
MPCAHGQPQHIQAGLTGFGGEGAQLQSWLAALLGVAPDAIALCSDIEIAYRASFAPGQGYLIYAQAPDRSAPILTALASSTRSRAGAASCSTMAAAASGSRASPAPHLAQRR